MTPYEVLGVREDAPHHEIRRAYVDLARRHHPDRVAERPPAERERAMRRMQEINQAWATLGDAERRRRLDAARKAEDTRAFRPFTPEGDDEDDEPDPRLVPDVAFRRTGPVSPLQRLVTVGPVVLLGIAMVAFAVGIAFSATALWTGAVVLFGLAGVGFLAIPLVVLGNATRDE